MDLDYESDLRQIVIVGLGATGQAGKVLGTLLGCLWPPKSADVWDSIRERVEKLIDQKLADRTYKDCKDDLDGIRNNVKHYLDAVRQKDLEPGGKSGKSYAAEYWTATKAIMEQRLPHFQADPYQLLLLPLYVQFINLYIMLLRDGIIDGAEKLGWTEDEITGFREDLSTAVADATAWVDKWYQTGLDAVKSHAPNDKHKVEPFRSINAYMRNMTLMVTDFSSLWPFSVVGHDGTWSPPPPGFLSRELYSDPHGTCDNSSGISLPAPPTGPIVGIRVFAGDRINNMEIGYEPGKGPGGATMAHLNGSRNGSPFPPLGGQMAIEKDNPIVSVYVQSGDVVEYLSLTLANGQSRAFAKGLGGGGSSSSIPGHVVTSFYISGYNQVPYDSAECIVIGFKLRDVVLPSRPALIQA
ncbi:MAG: hypothetical protein JOY54_12225 [Acidobacteriaceae bacterium]|nr:hypothetical protein [Acidobacteriaceae bacterium]